MPSFSDIWPILAQCGPSISIVGVCLVIIYFLRETLKQVRADLIDYRTRYYNIIEASARADVVKKSP